MGGSCLCIGGWGIGQKTIDELFPCHKRRIEGERGNKGMVEALAGFECGEGRNQRVREGFGVCGRREPDAGLLA